MKDFFISYNKADKGYAEWIAWVLEEAGYQVIIQAWDFRPGSNFLLEMNNAVINAKKTIAVLSENYLNAEFTQPEWAAAFIDDPQSKERKLIPIRVQECSPKGILKGIIYTDIVGLTKEDAKRTILKSFNDRAKPSSIPDFPVNTNATKEQENSTKSVGIEKAICMKSDSDFNIAKKLFDQEKISKDQLSKLKENIEQDYRPFTVFYKSMDIRIDYYLIPLISLRIQIERDIRIKNHCQMTQERISILKQQIMTFIKENWNYIIYSSYEDAIEHTIKYTKVLLEYKEKELTERRDKQLKYLPDGLLAHIDDMLNIAAAETVLSL